MLQRFIHSSIPAHPDPGVGHQASNQIVYIGGPKLTSFSLGIAQASVPELPEVGNAQVELQIRLAVARLTKLVGWC